MKKNRYEDSIKEISCETFANVIHTFANYDLIEKEAEEKNLCMKESKDHYSYLLLREIENFFKGKTLEEIQLIISQIISK